MQSGRHQAYDSTAMGDPTYPEFFLNAKIKGYSLQGIQNLIEPIKDFD